MTDWTAEFFGTRGLVKVRGTIEDLPFEDLIFRRRSVRLGPGKLAEPDVLVAEPRGA